jgi:hypothetical protein
MLITDLTVEVRNANLERVGQLLPQDLVGFSAVLRFNNVGNWSVPIPANNPMAEALRAPGAGIIVTGPSGVIMSGPTTSAKRTQSQDDPIGTWLISGLDDSVVLSERLAYPTPSTADVSAQTDAYDVRTGIASTVINAYVNANIGPSAPAIRKISALTLAADTATGSTVTGNARFDRLGELLTGLAIINGLGFDIKQTGANLQFRVYQPTDRSASVRMDIDNNGLTRTEYTYTAPGLTRAIVAGQGEGASRAIVEVTTSDSTAAEAAWARRIELFKDQRGSSNNTELTQAGTEALAEKGKTIEAISATPSDDQNMAYGIDWNLGDRVSVVVGTTTISRIVTEVGLLISSDGVRIGATVGEPSTADPESQSADALSNQEGRISNLERNEPAGGGGGGGGGGSVGYYGSFYDMTDQSLASITASQPIAIGVTAEANGVSISSGNRILFANAGTYSLTFSIQLTNLANVLAKAVVWVRKNGVNYPDSTTEMDLAPRKSTGVPYRDVMTINYVATAAAGDYVQILWAGDNLDLKIESLPGGSSPVYPAVPSIILTATQVGNSGLVVSPDAPLSTGVLWLDSDEPSDIPVPTGGTAGQMLAKIDSANYNTQWITPPSVPIGGTTGQALVKTSATNYATNWQTLVPSGGTTGQVLAKTSSTDYASSWSTPTAVGLVPIIPTGVTTVSGSASINTTTGVVTFTGVTTVNVDGVFSAAYNHYKILHVSSGASINTEVNMRMRASGTNYATANQKTDAIYYQGTGTTVTVAGGSARDGLLIGWSQGAANSMNAHSVEVFNPFNPTRTTYVSTHTSYVSGTAQGGIPTDSSYTGFALITGGTHSGTIEIYGYN